jgi:hypothetical protein
VVTHNNRIHIIGGDTDDGSYDRNTHSWDGLETSKWRIEEANFPPLDRAGHWGVSLGGYLWFGGGQTMSPQTPAPTKFFTDRWRSVDGSPGSWELYDEDCALGARGFVSSNPPIIEGEAYFVAGGTYQTEDYPYRSYRNDIMVMGRDFKIRCINPKNQMPGMFYHSVAQLRGILIIVCGHNGDNLKTVWASYDKGKTLVRLLDVPSAATHAATLQEFNGSLYFWGGLYTHQNCFRIDL